MTNVPESYNHLDQPVYLATDKNENGQRDFIKISSEWMVENVDEFADTVRMFDKATAKEHYDAYCYDLIRTVLCFEECTEEEYEEAKNRVLGYEHRKAKAA